MQESEDSLRTPPGRILRIAVLGSIVVALWLPPILLGHTAVVAGERYFWLNDDAMISMRYARNLSDGKGLVWNVGERVEGFSNPLWVLVMAAWHLLPISVRLVSLPILLINLGLAVATMFATLRLVRAWGGGAGASIAAFVSFLLNPDLLHWAATGLETTFLTLLFLLSMLILQLDLGKEYPRLPAFAIVSTLPLIRTDGLILAGLFHALAVFLYPRRRVVFLACASLAPTLAYEVFRLGYFGDLLPNTYYLKATGWPGQTRSGAAYTVHFLRQYAPLLALAAGWVALSRNRLGVAMAVLFGAFGCYVVYIGGDAFDGFRFYAPFLPLIIAAAAMTLELRRRWGALVVIGSAALLLLSPLNLVNYHGQEPLVRDYYQELVPMQFDVTNVRNALFLRKNTPENAKVADAAAGSVFYFSGRPGVDLLGKMDPHVARMPVVSEIAKGGHNKYDYGWSLGKLRPAYVIGSFAADVTPEEMERVRRSKWAFAGDLYFAPPFQAHCLPFPVAERTTRQIYACDWSGMGEGSESAPGR